MCCSSCLFFFAATEYPADSLKDERREDERGKTRTRERKKNQRRKETSPAKKHEKALSLYEAI